MPYDDERQRVAQTKVRAVPMEGQQRVASAGAGPTGNPLQKLAMGLGKKAAMGSLGPFGALLGGLFNKGGKVPGYNMGGQMPLNPHGYNEGGSVMGTPIKKVMDEDKLESQQQMAVIKEDQAEKAFMMEQERKDKLLQQQLQQKEEKHKLDMKLKKESATMKPPLSK